ncbi:MAG: glycosyltransferase [Desulfuromonadia bacterium]
MLNAPIVLFVFKRPDHLRRTIETLKNNVDASDHDLIIFSDAPRGEADREGVGRVREYIRAIEGFRSIRIVERQTNAGLARSIIEGVTAVLKEYDRVIVLEDDMETSPYFLKYMNEGLERYGDEERVISIHAYCYPVKGKLPETFFLKGADCWGWGTWRRGWSLFESDGRRLLEELRQRSLLRRFDLNGAYPYTRMLREQIAGKNDSWAIRWYASALVHDRLTLYPGRSLIRNIGTDASGSHCHATEEFETPLAERPVQVSDIPLEEDEGALKHFEVYFRSIHLRWHQRMLHRIQRSFQ